MPVGPSLPTLREENGPRETRASCRWASRDGNLKPRKLSLDEALPSWAAGTPTPPTPASLAPRSWPGLGPRNAAEAASWKLGTEELGLPLCSLALLPNPPLKGST